MFEISKISQDFHRFSRFCEIFKDFYDFDVCKELSNDHLSIRIIYFGRFFLDFLDSQTFLYIFYRISQVL